MKTGTAERRRERRQQIENEKFARQAEREAAWNRRGGRRFLTWKCRCGDSFSIEIHPEFAVTVVAVSEGYPGSYAKGKAVSGLETVTESKIYHAGARLENNEVVTTGGRVFAVTSLHQDLSEALKCSYNSLNKICYEGIVFRKDIGKDLLPYLAKETLS